MEFITKLFDLDLSKLIPEISVFLGTVRALLVLALLTGPVLMITLGAMYLLKPAPEANFKYGFRTYYGMGSVEAWQFSQKIAGLAFGGLGALLFVVMFIVVLTFIGKDLFRIATTTIVCLIIQFLLILIARTVVAFLCRKYFDKNGNRRK